MSSAKRRPFCFSLNVLTGIPGQDSGHYSCWAGWHKSRTVMEILHTETKSNTFFAIPIHSLATNIELILYKLLYRLNLTSVDKFKQA